MIFLRRKEEPLGRLFKGYLVVSAAILVLVFVMGVLVPMMVSSSSTEMVLLGFLIPIILVGVVIFVIEFLYRKKRWKTKENQK